MLYFFLFSIQTFYAFVSLLGDLAFCFQKYLGLLTDFFVSQVLASNAIFLGVVILIPFSLGRIVSYNLSWFLSSASSPMLATVMPLKESALSLANITLTNAIGAFKNLSSESHNDSVLGHVVEAVAETVKVNGTGIDNLASIISRHASPDISKGTDLGSSRLSDVTTLAIGYLFIFCLVFLYFGFVGLLRYARGERFTFGRLYGIASIVEAIPSLCRQFWGGMRHLMTMVKVAFLLVIELGVFPLMCGWWLDVCTIRMLGTSITQRIEFFSVSPLASSLLHWLVGIIYMLQISIFVSLLRGVTFWLFFFCCHFNMVSFHFEFMKLFLCFCLCLLCHRFFETGFFTSSVTQQIQIITPSVI